MTHACICVCVLQGICICTCSVGGCYLSVNYACSFCLFKIHIWCLSLFDIHPFFELGMFTIICYCFKVNGQNLERWSHDTAAHALKNAGDTVTLKVVYKPKGNYKLNTVLMPICNLLVQVSCSDPSDLLTVVLRV